MKTQTIKSRNPVAGNAWRYNKSSVIPNLRHKKREDARRKEERFSVYS